MVEEFGGGLDLAGVEAEGFGTASHAEEAGAACAGADGFADAVEGEGASVVFGDGGEASGTAVFLGVLQDALIFHLY